MSAKFRENNFPSVLVVIFKRHNKPYVFGSYASIAEAFPPEVLGCTLPQLWANLSDIGSSFSTPYCTIFRCAVVRKKQNA